MQYNAGCTPAQGVELYKLHSSGSPSLFWARQLSEPHGLHLHHVTVSEQDGVPQIGAG